jgi:hypothetical protein
MKCSGLPVKATVPPPTLVGDAVVTISISLHHSAQHGLPSCWHIQLCTAGSLETLDPEKVQQKTGLDVRDAIVKFHEK